MPSPFDTPETARPTPVVMANGAVAQTPAIETTAPHPAPDGSATSGLNLNSPELYLNRELTWLNFNRRVLEEALDEQNPLLERVKFLAITASNLDEFFMKRIGGLKQQAGAGMQELTVDGRSPQQQIIECCA